MTPLNNLKDLKHIKNVQPVQLSTLLFHKGWNFS